MYVREKGGKRRFYAVSASPDLNFRYWLRYEKNGKQIWQRVGHYDLVKREKLRRAAHTLWGKEMQGQLAEGGHNNCCVPSDTPTYLPQMLDAMLELTIPLGKMELPLLGGNLENFFDGIVSISHIIFGECRVYKERQTCFPEFTRDVQSLGGTHL